MDRREALKGLGLSLGYIVATPTIISLLQSCKTDTETWIPNYLTVDEGVVLKNLVNLILPNTNSSPGALEINVPEFIDSYVDKVYDDDGKSKFKNGIQAIINALHISRNNSISKLNTNDYDALLAKYLRASKIDVEKFNNSKNDKLVLNTLVELRGFSVWVYTTSQKIGEEVLAYDPIPTAQLGCISLDEATGGKKWSL